MYYQSIIHKEEEVPDIHVLVLKMLGKRKAESFKALKMTHASNDFYFVNDSHIDDRVFAETAVLVKKDDQFYQIESLSIRSEDQAIKLISETIHDFNPMQLNKRPTQLLIDEAPPFAFAQFTCSCCGKWFTGNVVEQLVYDQDNGYGICENCENYY